MHQELPPPQERSQTLSDQVIAKLDDMTLTNVINIHYLQYSRSLSDTPTRTLSRLSRKRCLVMSRMHFMQ